MEKIYSQLTNLITKSQSKYFNYPVAAILECKNGDTYDGVNIETSSPAAGICAERCAIFNAISDGKNKDDFKRIYLLNKTEKHITPCFICRQALSDYCNNDLEIISFNQKGEYQIYILNDLIPNSFGDDDLI